MSKPLSCRFESMSFLEVGAFDALVAAMRHPDSFNDAQLQCWGAGAISMSLGFQKRPWFFLGGGFIFYFHPYLGKWSNLANIFQMDWKPPTSFLLGVFFVWLLWEWRMMKNRMWESWKNNARGLTKKKFWDAFTREDFFTSNVSPQKNLVMRDPKPRGRVHYQNKPSIWLANWDISFDFDHPKYHIHPVLTRISTPISIDPCVIWRPILALLKVLSKRVWL